MGHESLFEAVVRDFLMLFVTIDPIGTLSLFVPLTVHMSPAERARTALRAVLCGGGILIGFLVLGQFLLNAIGVRIVAFEIAGGIILFLFGIQMVFGTGIAHTSTPEPGHDVAIFPLGIPSIAGPGAMMAVVVLTDNDQFSVPDQIETAAVLLAVLAVTLVMLLQATRIHRLIGDTGAAVLVRVLGVILASLAVEEILESIPHVLALIREST